MQVLIYVFDIESRELSKDMEYYASCLSAVKQNSKNAKIFCLVHKMDLIPEEQRDPVFRQRERELMRLAQPLGIATWSECRLLVPQLATPAARDAKLSAWAAPRILEARLCRSRPSGSSWRARQRAPKPPMSLALTFDHPGLDVTCFKTSIWDETLYRAWSMMVRARSSSQTGRRQP